MLIGAIIARRQKVRPDDLAKIIVYVLSPLAQFDVFSQKKLGIDMLALPILTLLFSTLMGISGFIFSKRLFDSQTRGLFGYACGLGNTLNFGLPVCLIIISGSEKEIIDNVMLYTLGVVLYNHTTGVYLAARGRFSPKDSIKKIFKIPVIYACFLGVLLQIFHIEVPEGILRLTNYAKGGLMILGLLMVGLSLASLPGINELRLALDKKLISLFLVVKFLVWPALSYLLIYFDSFIFHIFNQVQRDIIFLIGFAPAAVNIVVYSSLFQIEPAKAATLVVGSTLLATIITPLIGIIFF
jgi:malate permease and related proteins